MAHFRVTLAIWQCVDLCHTDYVHTIYSRIEARASSYIFEFPALETRLRSCRQWHKIGIFVLLHQGKFYANPGLLHQGKVLCQVCLAVQQGRPLCQ
jgi:hypothetical protein